MPGFPDKSAKKCKLVRGGVFGFVAVDPIGLFPSILYTVVKASVANCPYFGRAGFSRIPSTIPLHSGFSGLEYSCVLVERHGLNGEMEKVCHVHNLFSARIGREMEGFFGMETADWANYCWHSVIRLSPVVCVTVRAGI